jgi:predicted O-methyltransferase YrrM
MLPDHMPEVAHFVDDQLLQVGDLQFHCDYAVHQAEVGRLPVRKGRDLVERYLVLADEVRTGTLIELGIERGGSTALLHALFSPDRLVAIEIEPEPVPELMDYIENHSLSSVVRPYFGVDQSDRAGVVAVLDQELGGRPIDLVIDDASHRYAATVASFEVLFPRLRPGGLYVVEDWCHDQLIASAIKARLEDDTAPDHEAVKERVRASAGARGSRGEQPPPLIQLALELVVARASSGDVIRDLTINEHWAVVRRGTDELDPETFRLHDHVQDHFGYTNPSSR